MISKNSLINFGIVPFKKPYTKEKANIRIETTIKVEVIVFLLSEIHLSTIITPFISILSIYIINKKCNLVNRYYKEYIEKI